MLVVSVLLMSRTVLEQMFRLGRKTDERNNNVQWVSSAYSSHMHLVYNSQKAANVPLNSQPPSSHITHLCNRGVVKVQGFLTGYLGLAVILLLKEISLVSWLSLLSHFNVMLMF